MSLGPAALHAAAIASLGPHTDPRVVRIVTEGTFSIDHGVSAWETSTGHIVAHRVRVGLTAALLGTVRGHPHVEDEVVRVLSVAMATSHDERVSELLFHHDPSAATPRTVETPYRGSHAPSEPASTREADIAASASDYLVGFGEEATAAIVRRAQIETRARAADDAEVRVTLAKEDEATPRERIEHIERCLCDLMSGRSRVPVRCVIRRAHR